jgi:hypothetical protein
MHVDICNMHVDICNMHVDICNMHVGICDMHVYICNMHVHICNMHVVICNICNMHVHICNMHVQKFEHACSSFEQHAKIATMLTWDFFKIPCSEWNMHVPQEKSHVNMQHLSLMPF